MESGGSAHISDYLDKPVKGIKGCFRILIRRCSQRVVSALLVEKLHPSDQTREPSDCWPSSLIYPKVSRTLITLSDSAARADKATQSLCSTIGLNLLSEWHSVTIKYKREKWPKRQKEGNSGHFENTSQEIRCVQADLFSVCLFGKASSSFTSWVLGCSSRLISGYKNL